MAPHPLLPHHEDLRRALRWLAEHGDISPAAIEEAGRRFDLSPADEQFLVDCLLKHTIATTPRAGKDDG